MSSNRVSILVDLDEIINKLQTQENQFSNSMFVDIKTISNLGLNLDILRAEFTLIPAHQQPAYATIVHTIISTFALIPDVKPNAFYNQPTDSQRDTLLAEVQKQFVILEKENTKLHSCSENKFKLFFHEILSDLGKVLLCSFFGGLFGVVVLYGPVPAILMIGSLLHIIATMPVGVFAIAEKSMLITGMAVTAESILSRAWYGFFPSYQNKISTINATGEALVDLAKARCSLVSGYMSIGS